MLPPDKINILTHLEGPIVGYLGQLKPQGKDSLWCTLFVNFIYFINPQGRKVARPLTESFCSQVLPRSRCP